MGEEVSYTIKVYNALTGTLIHSVSSWFSDEDGNLQLTFPTITGHNAQPLMFFEISPTGESFKSKEDGSDTTSVTYQVVDKEKTDSLRITQWENPNEKTEIKLSPNPSNGILNITISGNELPENWQLLNTKGQLLTSGEIDEPNFSLDLSVYEKGTYILVFKAEKWNRVHRVIRM